MSNIEADPAIDASLADAGLEITPAEMSHKQLAETFYHYFVIAAMEEEDPRTRY